MSNSLPHAFSHSAPTYPARLPPPGHPSPAAVKLTDEQKANAYYLRKMEEAVAAASPAPAPVAAPTPAMSEEEQPAAEEPTQQPGETATEQPTGGETTNTAPAPVEVPKDGAATLGKAAVAVAAVLGAALLAL